jgi:DNA-binding PadR family transcriptional regulator
MSETRDKRHRTDLDLFVLALIAEGISTPYDLQKKAGLSQGATVPTLRRLLQESLVEQGKPGVRGRVVHRITKEGRKILKTGWKELLDAGPSGDLDADLRVALLSLWAGGERRLAADFLRQSAAARAEAVMLTGLDDTFNSSAPLASWYTRLRSSAAKVLLKGESPAALAMADALPRNLSQSPKSTSPMIKRK